MPSFPAGVHLKGGRNAAPVLAELAREFYAPIIPVVLELRGKGLSLRQIARELEQRGIQPRWAFQDVWSAAQVRRVLLRGEGKEADTPKVKAPPASGTPSPSANIKVWMDVGPQGPFTDAEIKAMLAEGTVTPETLSFRPDGAIWRPLSDILDDAASVRRTEQPVLAESAASPPTVPSTPAGPPAASDKADIRLWNSGRICGPYSEAKVKAMLEANEITLLSNFSVAMGSWRPLSELFTKTDDVLGQPMWRFRRK